MNQTRPRLGEILLESGLLSREKLATALEIQKARQLRLGTILLQAGFVSEPHLLQALSRHLSIPWVSIWRIDIPDEALNLVPGNVAEEFFLIPIYIREERDGEKALYVAMNDPSDSEGMQFVSNVVGMDVKPMIASPADIASAIRFYYYGEEPESVPPQNPLTDVRPDESVEDLSEEAELVSSEPLPIELYSKIPPKSTPVEVQRTSIHPQTDSRAHATESTKEFQATGDNINTAESAQRKKPRVSLIPDVEIPDTLSSIPRVTDDGNEVFQNKEAAQREAERRIYGVGRRRAADGFALTLLDGTTLSFSGQRESAPPTDMPEEDAFMAALKAVTNGETPKLALPVEKWQAYAAAALQLLFRKGLFIYDDFMEEVEKIENRR
ncbi:MAG: hypothetical protein JXR76_27435 [Deltaproteobacteria bacterium]|nr:hypothetical protein [Deltaproteobacteria bacterium]